MAMQSSSPMETVLTTQTVLAARNTEPPERTIEQEYAHAKEIVEWFEELWANDAEARKVIDKKDWQRFMNKLYAWLANTEQAL